MTKDELEQIRARMEEEHRLDLEALERVMRFLPQNNGFHAIPPAVTNSSDDPNLPLLEQSQATIIDNIEKIFRERSTRTWTGPQILKELSALGCEPNGKNPMATIGVAIKKLHDRGKISLVRSGSGRQPHIYEWRKVNTADCEVIEEVGKD